MILEDEHDNWQLLISTLPMARTPMDKKSGKAMTKYAKELRRNITIAVAPWIEKRRVEKLRKRLSKPPVSKVYDDTGKEVDISDPNWWKKEV